eukprot:3013154-Pleurochrysis_carterae.AAC.7
MPVGMSAIHGCRERAVGRLVRARLCGWMCTCALSQHKGRPRAASVTAESSVGAREDGARTAPLCRGCHLLLPDAKRTLKRLKSSKRKRNTSKSSRQAAGVATSGAQSKYLDRRFAWHVFSPRRRSCLRLKWGQRRPCARCAHLPLQERAKSGASAQSHPARRQRTRSELPHQLKYQLGGPAARGRQRTLAERLSDY